MSLCCLGKTYVQVLQVQRICSVGQKVPLLCVIQITGRRYYLSKMGFLHSSLVLRQSYSSQYANDKYNDDEFNERKAA